MQPLGNPEQAPIRGRILLTAPPAVGYKIAMNSHSVPTFDEVQGDLTAAWPTIFAAFETACHEVRDWFDVRGEDVNSALAHNIVRYVVIQHLEKHGFDAVAIDIEREPLANNGISLLIGRYHLRFRKLGAAGVPLPRQSGVLQDFYEQQLAFAFAEDAAAPPQDLANILVLWEVTAGYKFIGLHLACPASGVSLHWGPIGVPHPALALSAPAPTAASPIDDLPIEADHASAEDVSTDDQLLVEPVEASGAATTAPELEEIKDEDVADGEHGSAGSQAKA